MTVRQQTLGNTIEQTRKNDEHTQGFHFFCVDCQKIV